MKKYSGIGILFACLFLCACESGHVTNIVEKNAIPISEKSLLAKAVQVGTVEGEKPGLFRQTTIASNDEYKEVLEKVLLSKSMLIQEGQAPKYVLDAVIHSTYDSGITTGVQMNYDVRYSLSSASDHRKVWEREIQSERKIPPPFDGNIALSILFDSSMGVLQRQISACDGAAHDNVYGLIKALESEPKFRPLDPSP